MEIREAEVLAEVLAEHCGSGPDGLVLLSLPDGIGTEDVETALSELSDNILDSSGNGAVLYFWYPSEYQKTVLMNLPDNVRGEISVEIIMVCTKKKKITISDEEFDKISETNELDRSVVIAFGSDGRPIILDVN